MIKVDLVIPSIISYQKNPKYKKFHNLLFFQKCSLPSWNGNWYPIWYNLKNLKKKGVKVRFINYSNLKRKTLSNIVGFDSRIINNLILKYGSVRETRRKGIIPLLKQLKKKVDSLLYFDNSDSTGHFHYEVFSYVDRYFKKQLLNDRNLYTKPLYRKRLFTDFYARNYFSNKIEETPKEYVLDSKYQPKLGLSWNFALKDYRYSTTLDRFLYGLSRKNNLKFYKPNINRKIILAANFTIKPSHEVVYFQRNQLLKILRNIYKSNPKFSLGKIPKKIYLKTMRSSMAIVSPYGWGEICYRDFETFLAGAALIKPNMDHIDTWPNIYKKFETYLPIPWKIEEWESTLPNILSDKKLLLKVAKNGQNSFKKIWTKEGNEKFCDHFIEMVNPN